MPITISLLLFFAGLLLATWRPSRNDRHPLIPLTGLLLVFTALLAYLFSGLSLPGIARSLFVDAGLALLAVGGVLALRSRGGRPFLALGVLTLGAGILLTLLLDFTRYRLPADDAGGEASFLLELGPDDRIEEVQPLLERYDARYERAFPSVSLDEDEDLAQYFLVYVKRKALEKLMELLGADRENVDWVERNRTVRLDPPIEGTAAPGTARQVLANDPLVARQWGFEAIGGHAVHALLHQVEPARRATVAILDTGVDGDHEDLQGIFGQSPGSVDEHGHGTHCAGIAGAATNNGRGVASLNWEGRFVRILSFQALPNHGAGTFESIAQALVDATEAKVDVISMSLGMAVSTSPRVVEEAVQYAREQGIIVVASAGNANQDAGDHMPSNIDGIIAVAAVDQQLNKARFSNTTARLRRPLAAPGVDILSLKPNGIYVPLSGTSMAAPMVAGLLGVLRALDPTITADDAYALLHRTGTTVADTPRIGRVINAEAAVRAVLEGV